MERRRIHSLLAAAGLVLVSGACSSSSGPSGRTCDLVTTTSTLGNVDMSVSYSVTGTGDGTVSSVTYGTNAGPVVVHNPTLPWTNNQDLSGGVQASLSVLGHIDSGSLLAQYNAQAGGSSQSDMQSCAGSNN